MDLSEVHVLELDSRKESEEEQNVPKYAKRASWCDRRDRVGDISGVKKRNKGRRKCYPEFEQAVEGSTGQQPSSLCRFGSLCVQPGCNRNHPEGHSVEEAKEKLKKKNGGGCSTCNSVLHPTDSQYCKKKKSGQNYDLGHMEINYNQNRLATQERGDSSLGDFPNMEVNYPVAPKEEHEQGRQSRQKIASPPNVRQKSVLKSFLQMAVYLFVAMVATWFCTGADTQFLDHDLGQLFSYAGNLPSVATPGIVEVKGLYSEPLPYQQHDGINRKIICAN